MSNTVCGTQLDAISSAMSSTTCIMVLTPALLSRYKDAISKMSALFRDQQESPVERIVYWTEYAVRHKGARHMRSPELDLNWIQFLSLDILATVLFVLYLTYRLFKYILRSCLKAVFSNK